MAILSDTKRHLAFVLQPVLPTLDGPANAYDVRLREGDRVVFEQQYTTYPWSPDGHWNIWRLIRACQFASQVLDAKTDFNISGSGDEEFRESAILRAEAGWLTVALSGQTTRGDAGGRSQPYEIVSFYVDVSLLNGDPLELAEQATLPLVQMRMQCLPSAIEAFGDELLAECRAALKRREELGIAAPADDYIDT